VAKIIRAAALSLGLAFLLSAAAPAAFGAAKPAEESKYPSGRRVVIAFLPGLPPKTKPPLIDRIARSEPAIGFASAIQGSYKAEQTLLDIGAGARVWSSLYEGELPAGIQLDAQGRRGAIRHWGQIRKRARTPPADIVPGTLAELVGTAGPVRYVGAEGRGNREAIVAADERGEVAGVTLRPGPQIGSEAVRQRESAKLLVVRLPAGPDGARALARLNATSGPGDLLLVVEAPSAVRRRLLTVGATGIAGGKNVRSDTTRTDGLVSATDIAPTAMQWLGLEIPDDVAGEQIEASGDRSPEQLTDLKDRLAEVGPRRWLLIVGGLIGAGLIGAALLAVVPPRDAGSRKPGRPALVGRCAFLAALWLPTVLLVTGALAPSRLGELALIAIGCALLAVATCRLLPWPRAILLPAAVTVLAHAVDLALGSVLIQRSLLGPNPILGARFFGVGNELEATLGVIGLLGLGALLATAPRRRAVWGFAVGGSAIAIVLSSGRLGADVGASIMLAAGTAAAIVAALGERPGKGRIALILAAPLLALAVLSVLDIVTGGDAHFTRSVLDAGGLGELADIAQRRVELSYRSLTRGAIGLLVALAILALIWGIRSRKRILEALRTTPGLRAGLFGALVAVVIGALSNDSGPVMLLIGTCYLALAAGYFLAAAK
jgi:hypothetical protein